MKKEIDDNDYILSIVSDIGEYNRTIKGLTKDYSDKINELEKTLLEYKGQNDLKILKTGFPNKWKNSTKKLANPYEFFRSIEDYKKPVNNLEKKTSSIN